MQGSDTMIQIPIGLEYLKFHCSIGKKKRDFGFDFCLDTLSWSLEKVNFVEKITFIG